MNVLCEREIRAFTVSFPSLVRARHLIRRPWPVSITPS